MPKTLLLADDSVTIQKVVGISFANEDIVLLTVDNGTDALERAGEAKPDIILADVVMPGKNGYELCEAIKSDAELRHIPVLLLTGTFEAFDEERARRVGADGHITKPFEAQALVDEVNGLLARAQPPAPAPAPAAAPEVAPESQTRTLATAPAESAGSDDAYDFFNDDLSETAPRRPATGHDLAGETMVLGEADALPTLGEVDTPPTEPVGLASGATPPTRATGGDLPAGPSPDETVAILPEGPDDAWPSGDDLEQALASDDLGNLGEAGGSAVPAAGPSDVAAELPSIPRPAVGDEPFGFEEPSDTGTAASSADPISVLNASDLARETLLDPEVARGYDVSSSDLRDPLAQPAPAPTAAGAAALPSEPKPEARTPTEPHPAEPAAQATAESRPAPDLSPVMRERMHDTLEKIAWEALGDLSDTVARQALERVEAIAWEVIPQMAEALIREEIRRLKGEDEG